jgi:hypothetical protein
MILSANHHAEIRMEDTALQEYDAWLAAHPEELVSQYPSKVVAIHAEQVIYIGDAEAEVYQWARQRELTPMPLVFRVPRQEDSATGGPDCSCWPGM